MVSRGGDKTSEFDISGVREATQLYYHIDQDIVRPSLPVEGGTSSMRGNALTSTPSS